MIGFSEPKRMKGRRTSKRRDIAGELREVLSYKKHWMFFREGNFFSGDDDDDDDDDQISIHRDITKADFKAELMNI